MRKFISCVSAMAVIAATSVPAFADTVPTPPAEGVSAETLAAMDSACDLLAAAHEIEGAPADEWSGVATSTGEATLIAGPTEVAGTRVIDLLSVEGVGFHPSVTKIMGDPYRNGGSVNMFGQAVATAGYYDDSTYNFTADFETTYKYGFSCAISVEVYHPEETIHHNAVGEYKNFFSGNGQGTDNDDDGVEDGQPQGACAAYNATGDTLPFWGFDKEQCKFVGTAAYDEVIDEYFDAPLLKYTETGTIDQDAQTDNLTAFEDHGGYYEVTGEIPLGQVVICISPSTTTKKGVPGAWKAQNGYDGGSFTGPEAGCNTKWFDTGATAGVTNLNLQGTFISVPPAV